AEGHHVHPFPMWCAAAPATSVIRAKRLRCLLDSAQRFLYSVQEASASLFLRRLAFIRRHCPCPGGDWLPRGKAVRPRRPPPQRSPAGLSRERIVAAALAIIDAEGIEGFSMRGLAQALGVYPTA